VLRFFCNWNKLLDHFRSLRRIVSTLISGRANQLEVSAHLLTSTLVTGSGHFGSFATRIVGVVRVVLTFQAHNSMRHLLRRVRGARGRLKMLMRAHGGRHLGKRLVLGLLLIACVHHIATFPKLLQVLLQAQLRVGHVLLLLLRGWCIVVIDVCARSSAHLRAGIGIG
jgi:hypothetical protein